MLGFIGHLQALPLVSILTFGTLSILHGRKMQTANFYTSIQKIVIGCIFFDFWAPELLFIVSQSSGTEIDVLTLHL